LVRHVVAQVFAVQVEDKAAPRLGVCLGADRGSQSWAHAGGGWR
jgi:hypothetical protein